MQCRSDRGLRKVSRVVYGDPVLLSMDYAAVLAAVEEAVDDTMVISEWLELPLMVMRKYTARKDVDVVVHASRQRAVLSDILEGDRDAQLWLEESVYRSGTEKRTLFMADYDYLSFIRPAWRDATVRLLGKAPLVTEVFRLPWCIVDSQSLSSLCYRMNVHGVPAASARGHSLVEFVHTRLAGSLTAREMIGTWVGGLLCDDLTAVDTIQALGDRTLAPLAGVPTPDRNAGVVRVPEEYAWMYAAVRGVSIQSWDGLRYLDGTPRVETCDTNWAETLPFAQLYTMYAGDVLMSASVVQFFYRLHSLDLSRGFVKWLLHHARSVCQDGVTQNNFDVALTPMLPGYNYLLAFSPCKRLDAVEVLGCSPNLMGALAYAAGVAGRDGLVSQDELAADLSRDLVFSGCYVADFGRVGHAGKVVMNRVFKPGYCYECMFQPKFRWKVRRVLKQYPELGHVVHWRFVPWYIDRVLDVVHVSPGRLVSLGGRSSMVLHLEYGGEGPTLREYLRANGKSWSQSPGFRRVRVGQSGVCYSTGWFVSAIIAWSIVGVVLLGYVMFLTYRRCAGGGSSGGGRAGFRRY